MAILNKTQIKSAEDIVKEEVEVPEWGGSVILRTLSGAERDSFEASIAVDKKGNQKLNLANLRARLVGLCMVNEEGSRIFSDLEVLELGMKSAKVLDRLFAKCQEMNGLTPQDVEELTGDFSGAQSEPSTSD